MDERVRYEGTDVGRKEAYSVDIEALRAASRRDLPSFSETSTSWIEWIANRKKRGVVMKLTRGIIDRPRLATGLAGCAIAAVLLFVPISYEKTVGHDVAFTLSGMTPGAEAVAEIAKEMKESIGAEVDVSREDGRARICVRASAEGNPGIPEIRCETESGTDPTCVRIEVRRTPGMTDADVIADIERQLAEQGLSGTVTLDGAGCPKVELDK